jgi:hypothetical protein
MTVWRRRTRRTAIQQTAATVARNRDHQEGDRAPLDCMKLLAQAPADVADAGDAPDMLGSRRHSVRVFTQPGSPPQKSYFSKFFEPSSLYPTIFLDGLQVCPGALLHSPGDGTQEGGVF